MNKKHGFTYLPDLFLCIRKLKVLHDVRFDLQQKNNLL